MDEKLNLDEIEKACEIASPGPLEFSVDTLYSGGQAVVWVTQDFRGTLYLGIHTDDEEWLKNATIWLPALVQELREARYTLGRCAAMYQKAISDIGPTIDDNAALREKVNRRHGIEVVLRVRELELEEERDVLRERVEALETALDSWKFGYTQAVSERSEEREKWIKCFARVETLESELCELQDNDAALLKLEALHRKVESEKQAKLRARVETLEAACQGVIDEQEYGSPGRIISAELHNQIRAALAADTDAE